MSTDLANKELIKIIALHKKCKERTLIVSLQVYDVDGFSMQDDLQTQLLDYFLKNLQFLLNFPSKLAYEDAAF